MVLTAMSSADKGEKLVIVRNYHCTTMRRGMGDRRNGWGLAGLPTHQLI